ncbi:hypothetical protein VUR80DRAFT_710 [Thermomyces stellatus]
MYSRTREAGNTAAYPPARPKIRPPRTSGAPTLRRRVMTIGRPRPHHLVFTTWHVADASPPGKDPLGRRRNSMDAGDMTSHWTCRHANPWGEDFALGLAEGRHTAVTQLGAALRGGDCGRGSAGRARDCTALCFGPVEIASPYCWTSLPGLRMQVSVASADHEFAVMVVLLVNAPAPGSPSVATHGFPNPHRGQPRQTVQWRLIGLPHRSTSAGSGTVLQLEHDVIPPLAACSEPHCPPNQQKPVATDLLFTSSPVICSRRLPTGRMLAAMPYGKRGSPTGYEVCRAPCQHTPDSWSLVASGRVSQVCSQDLRMRYSRLDHTLGVL